MAGNHYDRGSGSYILAVQAPIYPIGETAFAVESAFSHHLKQVRDQYADRLSELVVVAPVMSEDTYRQNPTLTIITSDSGITFLPAQPDGVSIPDFWRKYAGRIWSTLDERMRGAKIVHSGLASDIWRPLMLLVNLAAWRRRKPLLFVVDIDFRNNTKRLRHLGIWNRKSYLTNRLFHDPLRWLQVWVAVRTAKLALLKSPDLVRAFGADRPHVKNFLDSAFSTEDVLSRSQLRDRIAWLRQDKGPIKLVYFGRLVHRKGLHLAIEAVSIAKGAGHNVHLTLLGDGPCLPELRQLAERSGVAERVAFLPPVPYGQPLFDLLSGFHASIACPLVEDTPRAALDSMARGLPLIAFDLDYFQGLADASGAVTLARWPSADDLAHAFVQCGNNRSALISQFERAVTFAGANTQQVWLEKRRVWMDQFLFSGTPAASEEQEDAFA